MKKHLSILLAMLIVVSSISVLAAPTYNLSTMGQENSSTRPAVPETKASDGAKENYFELAGVPNRGYYLLETMADGRHFVLTNETYGKAAWDTKAYTAGSGEGRYPDLSTTSETNIMYKLNTWLYQGKTLTGGTEEDIANGYILLPSEIRSNIVTNTQWPCFGDWDEPNGSGQFTITAPISILDLDEVVYYRGKFANAIDIPNGRSGLVDNWSLTRRPRYHATAATDTIYATRARSNDIYGAVGFVSWSSLREIRPCFYLKEDFFGIVKINPTTAGSNVKATILNKYTVQQMAALGYNDTELATLGYEVSVPEVSNVTISGAGLRPGYTLTVNYSLTNADDAYTKYQWLLNGSPIANENSKNYIIKNNDASKTVTCRVTPNNGSQDGVAVTSNSVTIQNSAFSVTGGFGNDSPVKNLSAAKQALYTAINPQKNMFKVGDKYFSLIAYMNGTDGYIPENNQFNSTDFDSFYIFAGDTYGKLAFDTDTSTYTSWDVFPGFNPSSTTNIAYKIQALAVGEPIVAGGATLPSGIASNIVKNALWLCPKNGGSTGGMRPNDYVVEASVGLFAVHELVEYVGRYGYQDVLGTSTYAERWYTRSPRTSSSATVVTPKVYSIHIASSIGGLNDTLPDTELNVRPAFYLNSDFFKNVKLDLAHTGSEIRSFIRSKYNRNDLEALYSTEELDLLFENVAVSDVKISGYNIVGQTLTGTYNYTNSMSNPESGTAYAWYSSDTADGVYTKISDATSMEYVIDSSLAGKYIKFGVDAKYSDGMSAGEVFSSATPIIVDSAIKSLDRETKTAVFNLTSLNNATVYLIIAAYSQDKELVSLTFKTQVLTGGVGTGDVNLTLTDTISATDTIKAMAFESGSLKPLCGYRIE